MITRTPGAGDVYRIVGIRVVGDVLAALARTDREFTGRELARHIGYGSAEGVRRAADRLVAQGVVLRRTAGSAHLYRLNGLHLAAPWIEGLASLREQLIRRLRELLVSWDVAPALVLLFGSVARGQASARSDLDLLVVRRTGCDGDAEPWQAQLLELQQSATAWTGNDARVVEYSEDELADQPSEPMLLDAFRDGVELLGSRRVLRQLVGETDSDDPANEAPRQGSRRRQATQG